jgi:predicted O-methyltransferase YrrM
MLQSHAMPEVIVPRSRQALCDIYNFFRRPRPAPKPSSSTLPELQEIEVRAASRRTDICDHLPTLFAEALATQPKLIVELGVRGGESTFALERAAKLADAHLLDVDLDECAAAGTYAKRSFVRGDDVAFAQQFPAWCASHGTRPVIDVLFIDTSHLYEHTREELRVWVPFLAPRGKLLLHDTNMRALYRRNDGSLGAGWDNERGVIRAIEEMVGARLDERRDFVTVAAGWLIRHWAHCSGLTVLERC